MNQITIVGRVGKKPEYTETQGGTQIAKFSLATTESSKDKGGNWQKRSVWHRVIFFGKKASAIEQFVDKGLMVAVFGKLSFGEYEKDGQVIKTVDIIGNDFSVMFAPKEKSESDPPKNYDDIGPPPFSDDDIPF